MIKGAIFDVDGTLLDSMEIWGDALYALMTAKNAGFRTVGVYDRFSEGEQEEIKRQADVYLRDLTELKWKERGMI